MNQKIIKYGIRFLLILFLQVLVLQRIDFEVGDFAFIHLIVYPYFIFLLPINTPRVFVMLLAFVLGLSVDAFYNSPGVHASAIVFTAYIRNWILKFLEPFEGYNVESVPSIHSLGFAWYISFSCILLIFHLFLYFSIEAFSFVFFYDIFMNTIFSFFVSIFIIILIDLIFKP
jgi:hypothetical protein